MHFKRSLFSRYYFLTSFTIIFFITIGVGSYLVLGKYNQFKAYALQDKINEIENKKILMKDIVDSYLNQADKIIEKSEAIMEKITLNRVNTAHNICMHMYEKMKDTHSKAEIQNAILAALSSMVYGNEYVFVLQMDGVIVSSPLLPQIEGKNLINKQDAEGNYTIRESIEIVRKDGEGYMDVYWTNPSDVKAGMKKKRVFIKYCKPMDWIIGYGVYVEDHEEMIKHDVIRHLESVSYENGGYLFATTYDGVSLTKPAKGRNMYDVQDVNGLYIVRELISKAKLGGGFVEYVMPPFKGARPETKLSYVAPIKRWGWYVGTGMYITDIEASYQKRMDDLFKSEKKEIAIIIFGLLALLAAAGGAVYVFSGKLQALVDKYNSEINEKNEELREMNKMLEVRVDEKTAELNNLNQSLEQKVAEEVVKNREKDRIMFQQGRLAAMGEMIGNIAHQWRQPLSSISLLVQDIQEAHELGELNTDYLNESVGKCTATIAHMSDTIDNFRYFFDPQKEQVDFDVDIEIKRCMNLLDAGLENNDIQIYLDLNTKGSAHGVPGEYSQVLVNILNNSREALLQRVVKMPYIQIKSYNKNNEIVVEIRDNAGGISEGILDKIFEPYFTTKNNTNGTGIGLYFSKMIIDGNMKGLLSAKNDKQGACFTISVPAR